CLSVLAASYTATVSLSLHDALPILSRGAVLRRPRSLLAIVRSDRDGGECPRAPCTRARRGPVAGSNGFCFFPRPAQGALRGDPDGGHADGRTGGVPDIRVRSVKSFGENVAGQQHREIASPEHNSSCTCPSTTCVSGRFRSG